MKKSQILAALALAFSLGVVAPVAGLANTASALTIKTDTTFGKASCDEVNKAVAGLKADSAMYVAESTLFALNDKYTAKNVDLPVTMGDGIKATLDLIAAQYYNVASVTPTTGANTVTEIRDTVNAAKNITVNVVKDGQTIQVNAYDLWNNIFKGIEAKATDGGISLKTALNAAYSAFGTPLFNWATQNNISQYVSLTQNPLTSLGEYNNFKTLITDVKAADVAIAAYDAAIAEYKTAFNTYGSKVLTATGQTQYNNITNATTHPNLLVADFIYIVDNARGAKDWIKDRTVWYNVYDAVKTAGNGACDTDNSEETNYNNLMDIAKKYITATWDRFVGKDDFEVAQYLMGVKADDTKPSDDNQGNGNTNNGSEAQDPSAPGTGIVSSAEGNAATTVSIVAGLATALTALGAGVVAYRSARRSNK